MKKFLLHVETIATVPWFILSWSVSAIFFAIKGGYMMAKADGEQKAQILEQMFPSKAKTPK